MIEERYLNATKASNLRDDTQRIGQVDVIKASGMSARNISSTYLRLVSKPTQEDMTRFYAALLHFGNSRQLDEVQNSATLAVDAGPSLQVVRRRRHSGQARQGSPLPQVQGRQDAQGASTPDGGRSHRPRASVPGVVHGPDAQAVALTHWTQGKKYANVGASLIKI